MVVFYSNLFRYLLTFKKNESSKHSFCKSTDANNSSTAAEGGGTRHQVPTRTPSHHHYTYLSTFRSVLFVFFISFLVLTCFMLCSFVAMNKKRLLLLLGRMWNKHVRTQGMMTVAMREI